MSGKKKVKTTISLFKILERGGAGKMYEGRLLGLINDEQFATLMKEKEIQNKFLTTEATSLWEITEAHKKMNGLRLCMAVKKIDNVEVDKHIFVSEKLELISNSAKTDSSTHKDIEAAFTGEESYWLWVEESEEK
jgi:hypothetical protein